jgi:hypothetical protein
MSARPTVHSSLIIPVLHRTAVGSDFFLGFPGENARNCSSNIEVQAGLLPTSVIVVEVLGRVFVKSIHWR